MGLQDGIASSTAFTMAGPPWTCSSSTSSPVTVCGAGKKRTKEPGSRIRSLESCCGGPGSTSLRKLATRGRGSGRPGQSRRCIYPSSISKHQLPLKVESHIKACRARDPNYRYCRPSCGCGQCIDCVRTMRYGREPSVRPAQVASFGVAGICTVPEPKSPVRLKIFILATGLMRRTRS